MQPIILQVSVEQLHNRCQESEAGGVLSPQTYQAVVGSTPTRAIMHKTNTPGGNKHLSRRTLEAGKGIFRATADTTRTQERAGDVAENPESRSAGTDAGEDCLKPEQLHDTPIRFHERDQPYYECVETYVTGRPYSWLANRFTNFAPYAVLFEGKAYPTVCSSISGAQVLERTS